MENDDDFRALMDRLGEFLASDSLEGFRAKALRRCSSVAPLLASLGDDPGTSPVFLDYLAFCHRDGDGRTAVDLFLEEKGPSLDGDTRKAFALLRETVFGTYVIEGNAPPVLRVRRAGTDDRYAVEAHPDMGDPPAGSGFVARLVPVGKRHVITGHCMSLAAMQVSEIDRLARAGTPEARSRLPADPIAFLESMMAGFLQGRAPGNLEEAKVHAAPIFAAADFPYTVEEVAGFFRRSMDLADVMEDCGLIRARSPDEFRRLVDALLVLWNHAAGEGPRRGRNFAATFDVVDGEYGRIQIHRLGDGPPAGC